MRVRKESPGLNHTVKMAHRREPRSLTLRGSLSSTPRKAADKKQCWQVTVLILKFILAQMLSQKLNVNVNNG